MEEKQIASIQVDYETGEVLNEWYFGDKVKTTRKESCDYLKSTEEINKGKSFTLLYNIPIINIVKLHLKPTSLEILLVMISRLGRGEYSGAIIKLKNRKFYGFMNGKDIMELVGCKDTAFKTGIKELVSKNIIRVVPSIKGRGNNFLLNPYIATHDKRVPKKLIEMFKTTQFNDDDTSLNDSTDIYEKIKCKEELRVAKQKEKERKSHYWGEKQK